MKQKQNLIIAGLILGGIIIILLTTALFWPSNNAESTEEQTPVRRRISEPVNQIDVNERPYIRLIPKPDGRNLTIQVVEVKLPAENMEYELEYQAGSTSQGEFKQLSLETLPAQIDAFFGSCSAGGACTYHTDILGGSLLGRFLPNDGDTYAIKQDWRYFDNTSKDTKVASKDAKFQLESTSLATQRYIVVYNTPGYPGDVSDLNSFGELVSDIYSLAGSSALAGTGSLTIRTNEALVDNETYTILGFDGSEWIAFETVSDGRMATAEVSLLDVYLVVK